ncbi:MAG: hypothetical protein J5643_05595 [Lachnospiraceae bacterium]|nr:hypothetical protein [Lachnospiraceae bacterium]
MGKREKNAKMTKKSFIILIGTLLAAGLIAWGALVVGIFRKKEPESKSKAPDWIISGELPEYDIPEIPEGYKLKFELAETYTVSAKGKKTRIESREFDKKGNCVKIIHYDGKEKMFSYTLLEYDEHDNMVLKECFDAKNKKTAQYKFSYDENGRCTEEISEDFESDLTDYRICYAYDSEGNKVRETRYNSDGSIFEDKQYNSNGDLLMQSIDASNASYYSYNEDGKLLSVKVCSTDGIGMDYYSQLNRYSEDGLLLEEVESPGSDNESKTVYEYDGSGKIQKTTTWKNGRLIGECIYENGYPTERYSVSEDGTRILQRRFKNDEFGNHLKSQSYQPDGKISLWAEMEYDDIGVKYGKYTTLISKDENGNINSIVKRKYSEKDGHLDGILSELYYDPDGAVLNNSDGYNGFVYDLDSYGNRVRYTVYRYGKPAEQEVRVYIPFVVPIDGK